MLCLLFGPLAPFGSPDSPIAFTLRVTCSTVLPGVPGAPELRLRQRSDERSHLLTRRGPSEETISGPFEADQTALARTSF